jgi:TPR repeat protein
MPKNRKRASDCYQLSADLSHAGAQACLGFCRQHGIGVEQGIEICLSSYQAAAEQQNTDAPFHSVLCCQYGTALDMDFDEAACSYLS